jgi:predicted glycosyltransferase
MTTTAGTFVAQASWVCRVPSVVFYDTENATLSNLITYPVCTAVVTPACYYGRVPARKHVTYAGYQELAYTHPRSFTADPARLADFGLSPTSPLSSCDSSPGARPTTRSITASRRSRRRSPNCSASAGVVISAEGPLPPALEQYRLNGPLEHVHHVLAFARLFIGESATMASESATLGTPAIFVSTTGRGYTDDQERRYGMTYTFRDRRTAQRDGMAKALEILADPDSKGRVGAQARAHARRHDRRQRVRRDAGRVLRPALSAKHASPCRGPRSGAPKGRLLISPGRSPGYGAQT